VLGNHEFFKSQGLRDSITLDRADIRRYRPRAAQLLEAFAEWAREHRVRLLATHPNMIGFESTLRQPNVPRDLEAIDALHRSLGIVFVDRWDETMMDRGLFFDTVYHTDNVGSTIRTRDLARRLRPYIDAREWGPPFLPGPGVSPVELVDRAFYRIEPVSGFDRMAGLDPPEGEVFTRIRGSRAEALVRTLRASGARFTARLRSPERRQDIEVLVNAEPVILWTVGSTDAYEEFAADVHLKAGDNHLALVKSAANAVDVRELRVDLPGDAPAH